MKIYCTEQSNSVFDPYVGKNVWVKVSFLPGSADERFVYIRILECDSNYLFVDVADHREFFDQGFLSTYSSTIYRDRVKLAEPIEIIPGPTKLFRGRECGIPVEFIGKPVWIECTNTRNFRDCYVKVISRDQDVLECNVIDTAYINDFNYDDYDAYLPSDEIYQDSYFNDTFAPIQPLSILSDEDFHEILAENDALYWEYHQED